MIDCWRTSGNPCSATYHFLNILLFIPYIPYHAQPDRMCLIAGFSVKKLCEQTWGTGRTGLLPYSLGTLACKAEQENQPAKTRHDSTAPGKERASVLPGDAIWVVWPDVAAGSLVVQFSAITSWKETWNATIVSILKRLVEIYMSYHLISGLLADFFAYGEHRGNSEKCLKVVHE